MCYSALVQRQLDYLEKKFGATPVREQFLSFEKHSAADSKRFPKLQDRIYPGYYAPIIHMVEDQRVISPMRYSVYPPDFFKSSRKYTSYNARRDNLQSPFWADSFSQHHGLIILKGFYEWVEVRDLINARLAALEALKAEFERQSTERKRRLEAQGKKYRPTPAEKKDLLDRRTIIEFHDRSGRDLLVPVIFSSIKLDDGSADFGFAIVTDDPPPEVIEAGHDRCPVILDFNYADDWLTPQGKSQQELNDALSKRRDLRLEATWKPPEIDSAISTTPTRN